MTVYDTTIHVCVSCASAHINKVAASTDLCCFIDISIYDISGKPKAEPRGWNLEAWMFQMLVEVLVEVLVVVQVE